MTGIGGGKVKDLAARFAEVEKRVRALAEENGQLRARVRELEEALGKRTTSARALVRRASADTEDAIAVLTGGPRQLYASATILVRLALQQERHAAREPSLQVRDLALRRAIELKELARGQMVNQP